MQLTKIQLQVNQLPLHQCKIIGDLYGRMERIANIADDDDCPLDWKQHIIYTQFYQFYNVMMQLMCELDESDTPEPFRVPLNPPEGWVAVDPLEYWHDYIRTTDRAISEGRACYLWDSPLLDADPF